MQYNKYGVFSGMAKSLRLRLSCIGSVISRYLSPFDYTDKKAGLQKRKKLYSASFYTVISFLLGISKLSMGIYPFGLSVLISVYGKMSLYSFFGSALSTLMQGYKGVIQFITFLLIFFIRKNISKGEFKESLKARIALSFIFSFFLGLCSLFYSRINAHTILSVITYIILSTGCTYLFSSVFCTHRNKLSNSRYLISIFALCVCLIPAFSRLGTKHFDISLIFACCITLWISKAKGPIYGCVCGFIMGFACTNPLFSAPLGIGGLISGFVFTKSIIVACVTFPVCSLFTGIYVFGINGVLSFLPFTAAASLVFLIIYRFIPDVFSVTAKKVQISKVNSTSLNEFEKVSDSLSGLSAIIHKFAEHLKSPSSYETGAVIDSAFSKVCASCSMSNLCYAKKECNFPAVRNKMISVLRSRPINEEEFSKMLLDKCIKSRELCDIINSSYSELNFLTMKSNRTQTVACLYNSMSHLIKSTSKQEYDSKTRDEMLEQSVSNALIRIGVEFSSISVKGTRCKEISVQGIRADKIPCSSKDLADYLSAECRTRFSEPSFDITDNADLVMKFTRGEIIQLEYAQCCEAKSNDVNGDTLTLFNSDNGYFYSIIADGMGSGKSAAATSRLSCIFLEKMLSSGIAKNVCLELLNNLLLSKNDETFSTVDMLEIDKLNGSAYFIKAGAAPSFVLRKNHLYKIFSETPPVGIIPAFSAESTRFGLEKGDIIFMVSDGVIQSDADAVWLSELIGADERNEPAYLAKELIERSKSVNGRHDDASACVIKVI